MQIVVVLLVVGVGVLIRGGPIASVPHEEDSFLLSVTGLIFPGWRCIH